MITSRDESNVEQLAAFIFKHVVVLPSPTAIRRKIIIKRKKMSATSVLLPPSHTQTWDVLVKLSPPTINYVPPRLTDKPSLNAFPSRACKVNKEMRTTSSTTTNDNDPPSPYPGRRWTRAGQSKGDTRAVCSFPSYHLSVICQEGIYYLVVSMCREINPFFFTAREETCNTE